MSGLEGKSTLELKDIQKVFNRNTVDEVNALNEVNLQVNERDFVTIIGSNGAGKSSLLNIVAGVFPPERGGKVLIHGHDVTRMEEFKHARYVARVWQEPEVGTAANLTIEENLSLALLRGWRRGPRIAINKKRRNQFAEALSQIGLGLEDRMGTQVGTLSGGQRQALALVMATISTPSILLLDEHIATLDPNTAQVVLELTDMIVKRDQMSTLMVTHNMDLALRYGNRLVMMHKGKIILDLSESEKNRLSVSDLVSAFTRAAGEEFTDDNVLLSDAESAT
ncbi:MAG: ATP-binding cassette domain-containing protein [Desulfohalobiaceae bacterium]|nr:ATP-binding cassette domain-containing protein [Desulfohalobiaceae bacterium]